jgi:hypothetical protein
VAGEDVPWPNPPRDPGPWIGGPPVAPPGNTPLPPLPGAGGVVHGAQPQSNPWLPGSTVAPPASPWANQTVPQVNIPPDRRQDQFPGLPAPERKLVDRAPLGVLVVAAIVVIGLLAGVGYLVVKGGRQYPSAWDPRVDQITKWVAKERELDFEHPVKVNFLTEEEYSERATEGGDDDSEETKQYYEDQAAQLRALGFLTGDVDLAEASDTLSDSGTLAYYDPELEQVFVRGTELTHVLQDQNFDLTRLQDLDDGRSAVLRALAEGDATKVEDAYIDEGLNDADRAAYRKESSEGGDEAMDEIESKVPPIMSTLFASPYILGPQLIALLDEQGGWDAINEALQDPPTEEAMFDPLVYKTDAAGAKTVTVAAPEGTEVLEEGEFGPTTWYLLLASRLDPTLALAATDGWGGDQYVVYRQDDKVCLDAVVEGDTEADTDQLAKALGTWTTKSAEGSAKVATEDGAVQFTSCDPGKDAKSSGGEVSPNLLSLPVTRTQVYTQGLAADRSPTESKCYANGVIERFTFSQLSDPDGAFVNSAEGQRLLEELRTTCFG